MSLFSSRFLLLKRYSCVYRRKLHL